MNFSYLAIGIGSILGVIVVISLVSVLIISTISVFYHQHNIEFTVTGKDASRSRESSTFLVFTDKTTYKVDDSLINWRWDSADVYGKLQVGHTYSATLQGFRIPFLSMFPNIIDPKDITVEVVNPVEQISEKQRKIMELEKQLNELKNN